MNQLDNVGDFCPNEACSDRGFGVVFLPNRLKCAGMGLASRRNPFLLFCICLLRPYLTVVY